MVARVKRVQDLFPSKKASNAFELFANEMVRNGNRLSVHHVSLFASEQARTKTYNKANFYWYVINPLVDLGFMDKIPTWNQSLKRTQYCYVPMKFEIPRHPSGHGYYRDAWFLCKEWNELFFSI